MSNARTLIMPLATALAGLPVTAQAVHLPKAPETRQVADTSQIAGANILVSTGQDLLGFTVAEQADGTIIAQHVSHASHSSHASHHSHYSSR